MSGREYVTLVHSYNYSTILQLIENLTIISTIYMQVFPHFTFNYIYSNITFTFNMIYIAERGHTNIGSMLNKY